MFYDMFRAALAWTAEYQKGGWNLSTLSFALAAVMTVVETWGIVEQGRTIWRLKSVNSVESEMFLHLFPYFLLCALYGFTFHGATLILNALITTVVQVPILLGLIRF